MRLSPSAHSHFSFSLSLPPPAPHLRFVGQASRKSAEEHLLLARDGSFIVRESVKADSAYVISLKHKGVIRHLRILQSEQGFLLGTTNVFGTLPDLGVLSLLSEAVHV